MNFAPVIIFVYNRLEHTKNLIESLYNNIGASELDVYIFSDAAKNTSDKNDVERVRNYINSLKGFKSIRIIEREENLGLALNIINGVGKIISKSKSVVVLEDDLILRKDFILYINNALETYKDNPKIWSISGYTPDIKNRSNEEVYLSQRGCSWGWATWLDRWNLTDWNIRYFDDIKKDSKWKKSFNKGGNDLFYMLEDCYFKRNNSWAIRWVASQFMSLKYTVYPKYSLIKNSGNDNSGTHSSTTSKYEIDFIEPKTDWNLPLDLKLDPEIINSFKMFYDLNMKGYIGVYSRRLGLYKYLKRFR